MFIVFEEMAVTSNVYAGAGGAGVDQFFSCYEYIVLKRTVSK